MNSNTFNSWSTVECAPLNPNCVLGSEQASLMKRESERWIALFGNFCACARQSNWPVVLSEHWIFSRLWDSIDRRMFPFRRKITESQNCVYDICDILLLYWVVHGERYLEFGPGQQLFSFFVVLINLTISLGLKNLIFWKSSFFKFDFTYLFTCAVKIFIPFLVVRAALVFETICDEICLVNSGID